MRAVAQGALIVGDYRYLLWRQWSTKPPVRWVMLNPSTADGTEDDATIRKCVGFSRRWGWGGIEVVNLFAYRSTDPRILQYVDDPVGPKNLEFMHDLSILSPVVLGWGAQQIVRDRPELVEMVLGAIPNRLECLGKNRDGSPKHPLMLPYETSLEPWR